MSGRPRLAATDLWRGQGRQAAGAWTPQSGHGEGAAADAITLAQLRRSTLAQLEALYAAERPVGVPTGVYRGVHLAWLDTPGARHPVIRPLQHLGFRLTPFGIDFRARCWFFLHRRLVIGRFAAEVGGSRWRDTETVRLSYEDSRLPHPLRALLYDEVKPLSSSLCVGIGGINAPRGRGDHFFFALEAA